MKGDHHRRGRIRRPAPRRAPARVRRRGHRDRTARPGRARRHRRRRPRSRASTRPGPRSCTTSPRFSHVGESWSSPSRSFRVNVEGTLHVLDAACLEAKVAARRRDRQRRGVRQRRARGRSRSARTRRCARSRPTARARSRPTSSRCRCTSATGLDVVRVRPFDHTGPGQSAQLPRPRARRRASSRAERDGGDEIPVGNLDPVRDLNDVRDIVRAYRLLAIERRSRRGLQRLLGRRACPSREIADTLARARDTRRCASSRPGARAPGRRAPAGRATTQAPCAHRLGTRVHPGADARRRPRGGTLTVAPVLNSLRSSATAPRVTAPAGRASRAASRSRAGRAAAGGRRSRSPGARRSPCGFGEPDRVGHRNDVVVGAVDHEQRTAGRSAGRSHRVEGRDRACPGARGRPDRRTRRPPAPAVPRNHAGSRDQSRRSTRRAETRRCRAPACRCAPTPERERSTDAGTRDPHAGDVAVGMRPRRPRRAGRRSSPRSRSRLRDAAGPPEGEREHPPARLRAMRSASSGKVRPTPASPAAASGSRGSSTSPGDAPVDAGRAQCAASTVPSGSSIVRSTGAPRRGSPYPGDRDGNRARGPGVQGMGGGRARAARGRADPRRPQGRPARGRPALLGPGGRVWLYPTAEHQQPELVKPAYRRWVEHDRGRGPGRSRHHGSRAGPTSSASRPSPSPSCSTRSTARSCGHATTSRPGYSWKRARPAARARAPGPPARRAGRRARSATSTAAAPRGSTSRGSPTRRTVASTPALSDVAFEARYKGADEAVGGFGPPVVER